MSTGVLDSFGHHRLLFCMIAGVVLQKLSSMSGQERADSERQVKLRSLGNIKFIAELFNKGIVAEKIVVICIDMLLATAKADPKEDNVEV